MFGWKKRQEEIEKLKEEVEKLKESYWELKRIIRYSNQVDAFRVGYELSNEFHALLIPVLYLYRNGEEYQIRFTGSVGLMFTNGKVRYENGLAYFDTDVHIKEGGEMKPIGVYHFVIDYMRGTYVSSVEDKVESNE